MSSSIVDIDTVTICAACGKSGDDLKACTACKMVKYCNRDCQVAHRQQHKNACKVRAAEIYDEKLFQEPPHGEECPICCRVTDGEHDAYMACCGKNICIGCALASAEQTDDDLCPFCREPNPCSSEDVKKRLERRVELNDPQAIAMTGYDYLYGTDGFEQDIDKALELLHRAAELGSIKAHSKVGYIYFRGDGVQVDKRKARYHLEISAMGGYAEARHNLGVVEADIRNLHRAMKHLMISASAGFDDSMKAIQSGYSDGLVNKDDFEKTLRAHQKSTDEMKSEWRDHAAAVG